MANEMTGMWGATDLNDLIRGLKMVLAQAEDVRTCGGTLADLKAIGTCGTCNNTNSVMYDYGQDAATSKDYPHRYYKCDEKFCEEYDEYWDNEEEYDDCDNEEDGCFTPLNDIATKEMTLTEVAKTMKHLNKILDYYN